jgi:peroxidase
VAQHHADRRTLRAQLEQLEDRLVPALDLNATEWRTINGTGNNVADPTQGAAETQQIRFGYGAQFPDGFGDVIVTEPQRENPRTISNVIHDQNASAPSARNLTDWAFQWGQWITHDMDLTRTGAQFNVQSTGAVGDYRIPIEDPSDPFWNPFNPFIPFNRSEIVPGTGVPGQRREVVNSITSYIDASMVYGSDDARAAALRAPGGKLKTSAGGLLLPLNTGGFPNADQFGAGAALFFAGDIRANEQIGLTTVHTLFVREHNRLADGINTLYPALTDDQVYQLARRLVGAEMQKITYTEYLPAMFGWDFAIDPDEGAYATDVDASITNSFAHAFFRFGHSQINETTLLVNNLGQTVDDLSVREAFFNPDILKNNPGNVGLILKGLASQIGQENDLKMVDGIRNNLFGPPGSPAGGLDLAALDIQRGRDHGLPDYNNLRRNYGLLSVTSFAEISSDPLIQAQLQSLFGNVNNIDPFVGALAEDHLPGSSGGALLTAIVNQQFLRLRDGDRFFYTRDPLLELPEVKAVLNIDTLRLSDVIKANTAIFNIQDNVFFDRSVVVIETPDAGANISVVAALGVLTVINNDNGQVLSVRSLAGVQSLILVGSDTSSDVFNLFIGAANGGIELGVSAYGGSGLGDVLNVFGLPLISDTFVVSGQTISNNITAANNPDVVVEREVEAVNVSVNNNNIFGTGFETLRLVTLGGADNITDPDNLALIMALWNPTNDN